MSRRLTNRGRIDYEAIILAVIFVVIFVLVLGFGIWLSVMLPQIAA